MDELKKIKFKPVDSDLVSFFVVLAILSVFFVLGLRVVLFGSSSTPVLFPPAEISKSN